MVVSSSNSGDSSSDGGDKNSSELEDIDFHFAPDFWKFLLNDSMERNLCAVSLAAGSHNLMRLAFKSFEMCIPFCNKRLDGTEIDACTDQLFKGHIQKVEAEKRGEGSFLKRIARKVNCEGCNIGRANKLCVQKLCKQCCSASSEIEKCIAHKKSLVV
jgi:hypothetical protein